MDYLKYTPTEDELKKINYPNYWQVWQGLPDVKFETAKARGGQEALFYGEKGNYIWVIPESLVEHNKNSQAVYFALMQKNDKNKIKARWVMPAHSGLKQAIEKAKDLNSAPYEP
ncbi:MAG: hypothetical protein AABW63_03355 [Nanoarchaeota archaeon]